MTRIFAAGLLAAGLLLTAASERAAAQRFVPQAQPDLSFTAVSSNRAEAVLFAGPARSGDNITVILYGPTRRGARTTGAFALQYTRPIDRSTGPGANTAVLISDGTWFQTFINNNQLSAVIYGKVIGGNQDISTGFFSIGGLTAGLSTAGGTGPSLTSASGVGIFDGLFFSERINGLTTPTGIAGDVQQQTNVTVKQPFKFVLK